MVFTAFVLMQIFNMINARKINDELNIFEGLTKNSMFIIIWIAILILQVLITQLTQDVFEVNREGLYWHQWLICFAIGLSVYPVRYLICLYPDKACFELKSKSAKNREKEKKKEDDGEKLEESKKEEGKTNKKEPTDLEENVERIHDNSLGREKSVGEALPLNIEQP